MYSQAEVGRNNRIWCLIGSWGRPERDSGYRNERIVIWSTDMEIKRRRNSFDKGYNFSFGMCEFLFQRSSSSKGR